MILHQLLRFLKRKGRTMKHWQFWRTYRMLSCKGLCDSPGSVEYRRVLREWLRAGMPRKVSRFIRVRANIGPYPNLWQP